MIGRGWEDVRRWSQGGEGTFWGLHGAEGAWVGKCQSYGAWGFGEYSDLGACVKREVLLFYLNTAYIFLHQSCGCQLSGTSKMRAAVHLRSSGPATHSQSGPLHSIRSFTSRVCSSPSTSRCLFGQRPERPSAGGVAAAASGRAAASQQRRKTAKEDEAPRRCPCGSGMAFSECCQPIVEGAWARSPPELARARFTAMQLGNAQLLADTTHPESLKAIGTKQQLLRKWEAEMRMRGAHQPSMVDMAFAQDPQDEDCWYVMSALTYPEMVKKPAKDSSPMVYIVAETYVKEAGRWCFYEFPRSFPTLEPLMNFIDKYEGNDSVVQVGPHG